MSGGSFDYLCFKDADELLEHLDTIQEMADELAKLGYANDAAKETQTLLLNYRAFLNRSQTALERLQPVWKAMEWWHSSDWGEDRLKETLAEYRGERADG